MNKITNINWGTVGSVAVGIGVFGLAMWAIRSAPSNAITEPVKKVAANVS